MTATITKFTRKRRRNFEAQVDQLAVQAFGRVPPNLLFHYTTWQGLAGIVASQTFWYTAHDCTNDSSELTSADQRVLELVTSFQETAAPPVARVLKGFVALFERTKISAQATLYLACFSRARDKPSQWRNYADEGRGVCLALRVLDERILDEHGAKLVRGSHPVYYTESDWLNIVTAGFQKVISSFLSYINSTGHDRVWAEGVTWSALSRIAAVAAISVKGPAWAEEEEWRSTAFSAPTYDPKPLNRDSSGRKVKYLPLRMRTAPLRLVFDEVILGPRCSADEALVRALFLTGGYPAEDVPPIVRSAVPL